MRLWRVQTIGQDGIQWQWFTNRREAELAVDVASSDAVTYELVIFPTRRSALVSWLNTWAGDCNG